jgi:hypothetical protein
LKCGAGKGWKRSVGLIMREMKMYYLDSRSRGIFYMKYINGRRTGLVTFYVETVFYNGLLEERYKGRYKWQEDKEDVRSYWMGLRKGEETLI